MTIGMLDGVVKVDGTRISDDEVIVYVTIGKLHWHPVTYRLGAEVEVFNMPDDLRGWYGV